MSNSEGVVAKPDERPVSLLVGIGCLYASFGVTFGMLQAGLPPILRAQGVQLTSLGWLTAILLPFGLTFLWASWLDRISFGFRAPRIMWIAVMQTVSAVLLATLGYAGPASMGLVFGLCLAVAFAAATMDVALDALTSQTVAPAYRPLAGGIKVGSLACGSIIGGGLFLAYFEHVGWTAIFLTMALLTILATIPILSQTYRESSLSAAVDLAKPSLFKLVYDPARRRHLLMLGLVTVPVVLLFGLNRVMLVDIGLPLEQVGSIVGTVSPIGSLITTTIAVFLLRQYGAAVSITTFAILCMVAVGMMIGGIEAKDQTTLVVAGAVIATAGSSGIYVATCSMILGWANSDQPATDYAALYGVSRFFALIILMLMAQAIPLIGWSVFFAISGALLIVGIALAARMLSRRDI